MSDQVVCFTQKDIKEHQSSGDALTNFDLIRLRALIMILATAASPHAAKSEEIKNASSSLRVLPVEGDQNSWPVVIGRLLFTFFGGNNPAIRLLHLTNEHDQIPGDFNECWATCYWAFQACIHAPMSIKERDRIGDRLKTMAETAFLLTLPSRDELLSGDIISVIDQMNESYASAIGIDPTTIANGHRSSVTNRFEQGPAQATP